MTSNPLRGMTDRVARRTTPEVVKAYALRRGWYIAHKNDKREIFEHPSAPLRQIIFPEPPIEDWETVFYEAVIRLMHVHQEPFEVALYSIGARE